MISCHILNLLPAILHPSEAIPPAEWLVLAIPALALIAVITYLVRTGSPGDHRGIAALYARAGASLTRVTGLPGWAAGGIGLAEWSILIAGIGFYWDVAWHVDLGRDKALFTPPHMMILVGLIGLGLASLTAIFIATVEKADTGWRILGFHVPYSAVPMGVMAAFAGTGFPLDDMWHATYGIDVTMWSPTHLLMIGGACLTPFAARLMLSEAGSTALETKWGRVLRRGLMGAMLTGLSAFMLEFDLGVPQWQLLYQPVLMMLATSIAMVAGRVTLGRGGAISVGLSFLVLRGLFAGLLAGFGHTIPRFPIYLGIALVIEVAWVAGRRLPSLARAGLTGLAIGTLGLASEWAWSQVFFLHPWHTSLLSSIWVAALMPVAGAVLGVAIGDLLALRRSRVPWAAAAVALVAVLGLMAVPFPRNTTPATATLSATAVGDPAPTTDREGLPSVVQEYTVGVVVTPAAAVANPDYFELISWQGGGARLTPLVSDGGGRYHSAGSVPAGGSWKTIVSLGRGDLMMAVPVALPADPSFGVKELKPGTRTAAFVPSSQILTAESHGGAPLVAYLAFGELGAMFLSGLVLLTIAYISVGNGGSVGSPRRPRRPQQPRRRTAHAPA